jgi:thiol-disulfide isomerase/thioredoxin
MRTLFCTASTILFASMFGTAGGGGLQIKNTSGPSLSGSNGWLNTKPLNLDELHGKVVLIDFWTYTCINWRRTLPYINAWASKYKEQGLVVIGVHTPEFPFEQKPENISHAMEQMNIHYPVAMDRDYKIWNSFENQYWPALYLIDAKGQVRYHKFGEGDYQESELQIQQLLKEILKKNVLDTPLLLHPVGFEAAADWENLQSPENYINNNRSQGFTSPENKMSGEQTVYSVPGGLSLNQWALSGAWSLGKENARLNKGQGKLVYRFHARDVNLIMGPATPVTSLKYRVLIDGRPPGSSHGLDIDSNGNGEVKEQRMYQLIRQPGPVTDHEFQIEFSNPGVEVYDFTFG